VTCQQAAADILLVLDQSTSIVSGQPNYDNWNVSILGFAKSIVMSFPIDPSLTQVGVIKFSDHVEKVILLNTYSDRDSLLGAIANLKIDGGETNLNAALTNATELLDPKNGQRYGAREDVPKILIMLADGTANTEKHLTIDAADKAKAAGIIIYTVGVGPDIDSDELQKIASKPEYFFFASNFTELNGVLRDLEENTCQDAKSLLTTTTATTPTTTTTTNRKPTTFCSRFILRKCKLP